MHFCKCWVFVFQFLWSTSQTRPVSFPNLIHSQILPMGVEGYYICHCGDIIVTLIRGLMLVSTDKIPVRVVTVSWSDG